MKVGVFFSYCSSYLEHRRALELRFLNQLCYKKEMQLDSTPEMFLRHGLLSNDSVNFTFEMLSLDKSFASAVW